MPSKLPVAIGATETSWNGAVDFGAKVAVDVGLMNEPEVRRDLRSGSAGGARRRQAERRTRRA